jgi:diguanylate cyclase (GGDEF)-like protein
MTSNTGQLETTIRTCQTFQDAANAVLDVLQGCCDLPLWMVTEVQGDDWIPLVARDTAFDVNAGDVLSWHSSICTHMVAREGPQIAPDVSQVPAYAQAPITRRLDIGCYIGLPYYGPDGEIFGTLCGIDRVPHDVDLSKVEPMLSAVSSALTTYLALQNAREEAQVKAESAQARLRRDPLTGLINRGGWERVLETAQDRITRSNGSAGIALFKLGGLHRINMSRGHAAGDEHLQACAERLARAMRRSDHIARLAGTEFGALLSGVFPQALEDKVNEIERDLREADIEVAVGWAWSGVLGDLQATWCAAEQLLHAEP